MNKKHTLLAFVFAFALPQLRSEDYRATHTPTKHFALGYKPDPGFPKGIRTFENSPFKSTAIKATVDLSAINNPDDDQGSVGRCTGFGLARAVAATYKAQTGSQIFLSPDFIYYNERVIEGNIYRDTGAAIGDGIQSLKTQGACLLSLWKTTPALNTKKPTPAAYSDALGRVVLRAFKVNNRTGKDVERAMSAGFMLVFGITLKSDFETLNARNYTYTARGAIIGGHCMTFVKYRTTPAGVVFTGQNQWGDSWGLHDQFEIAASLVHSGAVDDVYAIQLVKAK
jgi:hypothetical protein